MPDLFENPIGLDGFEFVEFCAPEKGVIEPVFEAMGFTHVATHRSKDVDLWRQGQINLILNYEPRSAAWFFAREHGPSACGMGFRVRDAKTAYDELLSNQLALALVRLAMRRRFDGPMEAFAAIFEISIDFGAILFAPSVLILLVIGAIGTGLVSEFAARNYR